jgi:hypothetical protein
MCSLFGSNRFTIFSDFVDREPLMTGQLFGRPSFPSSRLARSGGLKEKRFVNIYIYIYIYTNQLMHLVTRGLINIPRRTLLRVQHFLRHHYLFPIHLSSLAPFPHRSCSEIMSRASSSPPAIIFNNASSWSSLSWSIAAFLFREHFNHSILKFLSLQRKTSMQLWKGIEMITWHVKGIEISPMTFPII